MDMLPPAVAACLPWPAGYRNLNDDGQQPRAPNGRDGVQLSSG